MIEIYNKENLVHIKNSDNSVVILDTKKNTVSIGDYFVDFPWEYEKSWILLEVLENQEKLFYSFLIEGKVVVVIFDDNFEMKEEVMSFFWDVDILLIIGTKNSPKIAENIEARVVIPFGEGKDIFLHTLSQHKEEIEIFKLKWDMWVETTEFVNLK